MTFEEIKPNKTYYYPEPYKAQNKRSGSPRLRTYIAYRVISVNEENKTVLGSAGGAPPVWHKGTFYRLWITAEQYKEELKTVL